MRKTKETSNIRILWYSVLVWVFSYIVALVVTIPWFYLVLPFIVFLTTIYYFKKTDVTLAAGLRVAIFWFMTIVIINLLELFVPYYTDFRLYFSDLRNWFLYPLILLIPVIYTIVSENRRFLKRKRVKKTDIPHTLVRFGLH